MSKRAEQALAAGAALVDAKSLCPYGESDASLIDASELVSAIRASAG